MEERLRWYTDLGIRPEKLRLRAHGADELSHYSSATSDVEYLFPMGWSELEGIANRGDFDLTQHAKFSGEKLEYVDSGSGERYVPYVVEPAAGVDRAMLAFMIDAYETEEVEGRERTVLRLHPKLAPVKAAVLPLVNKDGQPEKAREIYEQLRELMPAEYDTGGSIGKRYRRQDEIGTPWGVTVDHQTMDDDTVTLRDRDSLEQVRIRSRSSRGAHRPAEGRRAWTLPHTPSAPRRGESMSRRPTRRYGPSCRGRLREWSDSTSSGTRASSATAIASSATAWSVSEASCGGSRGTCTRAPARIGG